MKKCPTCEKTYDDNLRFCQSDGTPLVEAAQSAPPPDPYATMVASKDEIMSAISPPDEPQKSAPVSEDDDLLDIPEESDAMRTMVVSDEERRELFDEPSSKPIPPPADKPAFPEINKPEKSDTLTAEPQPPKFSEPSLNPPSFGDLSSGSGQSSSTPSSPFGTEPPAFDKQPLPSDFGEPKKIDDQSLNAPIPSPFGEKMPPSYQAPSTPPFEQPDFKVEEVKAERLNTPFAEEVSHGNQQMAEQSWTPPAPPDQSWQDQPIGQNTPFQPPPAGVGEDKTMGTVSLVLGILSIFSCCFLAGIPAVIIGFMHKNKVDANPNQYGGRGLALGGIITGIIGTILSIIGIILNIMFGAFSNF